MTFTIVARGTGTLPVNNNDYSSVTIANEAVSVGDVVLITPTVAMPRDIYFEHSMYVSEVTNTGFTVKSSFKDLPSAVTFGYVVINESV